MHDISLITTIAVGLGAALVLGLLVRRLGLSPIVGYLLAGICIGPNTPGFVGDVQIAGQLAEIGVILLMFGVGLHFHLKELIAVRSLAVPGALGQSTVATLACMGVASAVGWTWQSGLVLGIAVSVASTVVLLRALMEHGLVESPEGHAAVGWLVVEDIITVLVLVLLPPLAGDPGQSTDLVTTLGIALAKLALLTVIILVAGARFVPWLLLRVARLRSRELFTLTVLVMAISVATASYVAFGASMALGAFLAGMVVGQSPLSHQAASDALPLRDAFAVLFFVAVGMLFDYHVLLESPGLVLGVVAVILVVKPVVAFAIVLVTGHSLRTGLTVAAGLAQIGEFSFIVGDLAKSLGLIPGAGHDALVAGAILSISLNPFLFRSILALQPRLERLPRIAGLFERHTSRRGNKANTLPTPTPTHPAPLHAIVIGFGPVGRTVTRILNESRIALTLVETNIDTVLQFQADGGRAIFGDATRPEILKAAGITSADYLVVTVPRAETCLAIVQNARESNPSVRIVARAAYLNLVEPLQDSGAALVRCDESEAAIALAEALLTEIRVPDAEIDRIMSGIRERFLSAHATRPVPES